ncbi:MAG: lanthionine synthetase C family protein [Pseudonocardiales bacterium]|nr:lanthionine synthetase C family protein [Pseudonocardiales bacterium]
MTATASSLPLRAAGAVASDLSTALAVPPQLDGGDGDNPCWRHQSLSKGAAGIMILHAVRAQSGYGGGDRVHAWLTRAVVEDLSVGPGAGLWFGVPAVAFAVATSAPQRYWQAMTRLGTAVADLARARLHTALTRMAAAARPSLSEFDLVRGLTGLGAHLLHRDPDGDLIRRVLDYLVRLTEPVPAQDDAGPSAPGWWTNDAPFSQPEVSGGHADLGMAHGISGPLALLALAMRRGVTVAGHAEAIDRICHWLDTWRQQAPAGPWWPERITLADLRAGRPSQRGPARPSWCYGTPGLARAQQLAALAQGDQARQTAAERALAACVTDDAQLARVIGSNLCHGWAGLIATVWYAAADAATTDLDVHLPLLLSALIDHADQGITSPPGLIEGRAGVALTLHTIATATPSGWPACLLIN